jgi:hypothetical protein
MNQHFGDNGQLCRSLHKNMTQIHQENNPPAEHHGTYTIVPPYTPYASANHGQYSKQQAASIIKQKAASSKQLAASSQQQ